MIDVWWVLRLKVTLSRPSTYLAADPCAFRKRGFHVETIRYVDKRRQAPLENRLSLNASDIWQQAPYIASWHFLSISYTNRECDIGPQKNALERSDH